jgi:two-component system sensor histidine kinase MtrB
VPGLTATTTPVYIYFVYSLDPVDRTLNLLWQVLVVLVAVAGAVAGAVGLRLADRTIRPLRAAADAARIVAEGELETRLEETGEDELARLARDFNFMTRALEERIARDRRFVSDVSHELRTPLTTLKTSIDYIADRVAELPPRLRSAVGLAADEVRSLGRLVDDLLDLTRVEAGGVHVAWEDINLRDFATEVVRRRALGTLVDIEGPDHLFVRTDKMRLERVVGNLVENAVVHGGGEDVRITVDSETGLARIVVMDRGPGIPGDQLPSIFDRFWRGDTSRQRDGRVGAGLGLAIARENARLIGADLNVESVSGEGTRFEVLIPNEAGL